MKKLMIILSLIVLIGMSSPVNGTAILAADEPIVNDRLIQLSPGGTWLINHTDTVYEQGLRIFGRLEMDQNIHFIIANNTEYLEWVATNDTGGLLYDYPSISVSNIYYRHDITTSLVFVIHNFGEEFCQGSINLEIDRTGPEITHDVEEYVSYKGSFELDFWVDDEHFGVVNASASVLGEVMWEETRSVYNHIPILHGSFVLNTLNETYEEFEDRTLTVILKGTDEGGNEATLRVNVWIDNHPPVTTPPGPKEFNWFSAVMFVGLFCGLGLPIYGVKQVWEKRSKQTKQERVDKINLKVQRKKEQKKREKEDRIDKWFDKREKSKTRRRKKRYGKK